MTQNIFRHIIIICFLIYVIKLLYDADLYYYFDRVGDEITLFVFSIIYVVYSLIPLWLTMTIKRVNKLGDDERLEYTIILSSDKSYVKHIYVSSVLGFFKYELDYPFTIEKECSYEKAKFFTEKYNTGKMLKNFMNNRATEEKRQNYKESDKTEFWSLFFVKTILLGLILMMFMIVEHYSVHSPYHY